MVSDLIESHSPVFCLLVCALFLSENVCKKLGGAFCHLLLNEKPMKPFVFPSNEISEVLRSCLLIVPQKAPPSFLHTFLLENEAQTSGKNIQGCDFL